MSEWRELAAFICLVQHPDGAITSGIALSTSRVLTVVSESDLQTKFGVLPWSSEEDRAQWRVAFPFWRMRGNTGIGENLAVALLRLEPKELPLRAVPPRFARPRSGETATIMSITPTGQIGTVSADVVSILQLVQLDPRFRPSGPLLAGAAVFTEAGLMAMLVRGDTGRGNLQGIALEYLNAYPAFREHLGILSAEKSDSRLAFPALVNPRISIAVTATAAALLAGFTALSIATALVPTGNPGGELEPARPQQQSQPSNASMPPTPNVDNPFTTPGLQMR